MKWKGQQTVAQAAWRRGIHLTKQQQQLHQAISGYGHPWTHTPTAQEEGERERTPAIANQAGNYTAARQRGTAQHANSCPVERNNRGPGSDSPGPTHWWWYKKLKFELLQLVQRELNISCFAQHKGMLVTYLQLLLFYFFNLEILILDQHGVDSKLQQEPAFLSFSSNNWCQQSVIDCCNSSSSACCTRNMIVKVSGMRWFI